MGEGRTNSRRVLVIGADGLRPDLVDPAVMPNLARLAEGGVRFSDHHAVYPSHTRVNMSALASGTTPGRHGIVANTMIVPGATDDHIIDTSSYQHIDALGRISGGEALHVPTLGEYLPDGGRVAVAGTSSGGSNLLWTHKDRSRIVNTNTAYGIADLYDLREKLGEIPAPAYPDAERLRYATRAVTELFLDDPRNRVIVLWLDEPDSCLHRFGLGSPEVTLAMAGVDACLGQIVAAMERRGIRDAFDIFFISDHGHSTVQAHNTLREYLALAASELGRELPPLTTASDYIYTVPGTQEPSAADLAPLVEWLQAQVWCDIVMAGREDVETLPGVLSLRAVWNGVLTPRRPLLAVSPRWTRNVNEHGIPGTVAALTTQSALKSSHGSASPFDMHALCIANGPSFLAGHVSDLPTGAIDLTPTVLTLLALPLPDHLDGRVLWEGLAAPEGEPGAVSTETLTPQVPGSGRQAALQLDRVGGTTYLHGSVENA
ncbi:MAG TPA: alkaline phosphatase family protein [Thermomicrobiales bacterium]|nr:alkaline phosphatase family protein [Thermomicrobiales bacterium]